MQGFRRGVKIISQENKNDDLGFVFFYNSLTLVVLMDFLGRKRGFAQGAQRLSDMLDAPLMSFVCQYRDGQHWVRFSAPGEDPYAFISAQIEKDLGQWWAMDVLGAYPVEVSTQAPSDEGQVGQVGVSAEASAKAQSKGSA